MACTDPAVFTGRLAYTDLQPDSEQEPLTDPGGYRAWFRARQGSGLPLTGMRWVLVGVAIDEGTRPRPDPATLRRNTWRADSPRVRVAAHCEGDRFAADRVVVLADGEVVADGTTAEVTVASPAFAPQVAKILSPQRWLTVAEVAGALDEART